MAQPGEINFYELLEHVLRVQGSLNLIQVARSWAARRMTPSADL